MKEIWQDIEGYNGNYQISNFGNVISHKGKGSKLLSIGNDKDGYEIVALCKNCITKIHRVHRLIGKAFIPNPKNNSQINHKNGIKDDNRISNLEWVTQSENTIHAIENGMIDIPKGERHSSSKLSRNDVLDIRNAYKLGCFSQLEIANAYNVSDVSIFNIVNRKTWKHL